MSYLEVLIRIDNVTATQVDATKQVIDTFIDTRNADDPSHPVEREDIKWHETRE